MNKKVSKDVFRDDEELYSAIYSANMSLDGGAVTSGFNEIKKGRKTVDGVDYEIVFPDVVAEDVLIKRARRNAARPPLSGGDSQLSPRMRSEAVTTVAGHDYRVVRPRDKSRSGEGHEIIGL